MSLELLGRDISGAVDYSLAFPEAGTSTTLTASVEQTVTTPAGYNRVFFSYSNGANVFVNLGATAAIPGASFVSTNCELNPGIRQINPAGAQVIHFISPSNSYVQLRYDRSL